MLVAAVTPRLTQRADIAKYQVDFESIPQEDILADVMFPSEDLELTRQARTAAAATVPDQFYVDEDLIEQQLTGLGTSLDALAAQRETVDQAIREALLASSSAEEASAVVAQAVQGVVDGFVAENDAFKSVSNTALLAAWLTPDPRTVPTPRFGAPTGENGQGPAPVTGLDEPVGGPVQFMHQERLTMLAREALRYTLAYGILSPSDVAERGGGGNPGEKSIVVRRQRPLAGAEQTTDVVALADVPIPARAQALLTERLQVVAAEQSSAEADTPLDWAALRDAAFELAKLHIGRTLVFDESATAGARMTARQAVEPVKRTIPRNARIQEGGVPWTEQSIWDYKAYRAWQRAGQKPVAGIAGALVAHMILVGLIVGGLVRSLPLLTKREQDLRRDLLLSLLIMCATLIVGRVVLYFEPTGLIVPVAAAAILLAILTNVQLATWSAFLTAGLVSIQYDYNWRLLVVNCAMSFAGVLSIFVVRRRNDMTNAAFKAMFVGVVTMGAIILATEPLLSNETLRRLVLVALSGAACLFVVPALLSPLERLFGITTDIQLLEYSDLNNEVLSRLGIEIPATYAHSMMLGQLAETAAASIGANGLLARVCAYYHDIGKLRRPEYFTENQTGANIHDELSPRLSARAIASHVSEGAEMARQFHLPKPVIDGIYEHHGTCLISFFYQEALAQQKHGDAREADFRYPGPRPQSRETAILMICDAVESGVRSIKNPNEERVRELVDRVVTGRANDRQFDECDITLKELDTVKDVVTKHVVTTLHRRIAYPDQFPDKKGDAPNVIPLSGGHEA